MFRVVRPSNDGKGLESVEHESRNTSTVADTGFSEFTAEVVMIFNPDSLAKITVEAPAETASSGMQLSQTYAVKEGEKGKVTTEELSAGFEQFFNDAVIQTKTDHHSQRH